MNEKYDANEVIDRLGGTAAVAKMFRIRAPSVSEWRARNTIPKARLMFLEAMYPELFNSPDKHCQDQETKTAI